MNNTKKSVSVLIVTGTVGVGKSTVADEIFEMLQRRSEPVALINIDEFGYVSPRSIDAPYNQKIRLKNLSAVWQNYAELGTTKVIIPVVIESVDELEAYRQAIPEAQLLVVKLNASPKTIDERIKSRSLGGDETWHLKRAIELTQIMNSNNTEDIAVNTDNRAVSAIADEIIMKWKI